MTCSSGGPTIAPSELPVLPHNLEAERAILGAVLIDDRNPGRAIRAAREALKSEDFFLGANRIIFRRMLEMAEVGKAIDLVTLIDELEHWNELERAGGAAYVSSLPEGMPRVNNVKYYAEIVRQRADLRRLGFLGLRVQEAVQEPDANVPIICAEIRDAANSVSTKLVSGLRVVTAEEFQKMKLPPREMILDPVLQAQSLSLLYSKRGVGKTFVSVGLAYAVATGGSFLGWSASKARQVLFVDGELPAEVLRERLRLIAECAGGDPNLKPFELITPDLQSVPMPDLATREGQVFVEAHLSGIELLILDNLSSLCRTGKENEGEGWLPVQEWALRLRQRGIAILFVHHAGKGGAQRGTSRREDVLDLVVSLRHPSDYSPTEGLRFELHFEKCRSLLGENTNPFEVRLERNPAGVLTWTKRAFEDALLARAAELFADNVTVRDAAEALQISKSKAQRIKAKLNRTSALK
jgi:hypothetical protein